MQILVVERVELKTVQGFELLVNGKVTVCVSVTQNSVQVLCPSGSPMARRGYGRAFKNLDVAIAAYKSAAVKEALQEVKRLVSVVA
jgi:hypothetical protein